MKIELLLVCPNDKPVLAFTRAELLIVLAMMTLLTLVVLPVLANNRPRSSRVVCLNNLRQVGIAQQLWGNDHNDLPPVMVPVNEGGTRAHPLAANTWLHFAWNSNELTNPKLLFCPSDTGQPAQDFGGSPTGGYLHPNFANRATSYFTAYSGVQSDPQWVVMNGDRNVTVRPTASGCGLLNSASSISSGLAEFGEWNSSLHRFAGNAQFRDGRVAMLSSKDLQATLIRYVDDSSSKHLAIPR